MAERRRREESENAVESRRFNFGDVPMGGQLPEGSYDMKIVGMEEKYSQEKSVLMYSLEFRVEKPDSMFGRGLFETFVFGTTPFDPGDSKNPDFIAYSDLNDPDAEDPLTLKMSRGVQSFKRIMHCAGVDMDSEVDMTDLDAMAKSGDLMVGLRLRIEEQKDGRYAGTMRNRISHVYEIGQEEPGFTANPASSSRRGARKKASGQGGRRRTTQPDNMQRAMNSSRARQQVAQDLGDDLPQGVADHEPATYEDVVAPAPLATTDQD